MDGNDAMDPAPHERPSAATADATLSSSGLRRSLRSRHLTMISMGGIIGAGLFVGSSAAIAATGPAIIFSYLMAGLLILLVMRMLAEMAAAAPEAGSLTELARSGLGHWAGFVSGWLYWYFWVVVVGIEAIVGGTIVAEWLPLPHWQIGLALLMLLTGVNLMSSRSYGEFEFWFASIKVAAIVVFIAVAGSWALGFGSSTGPTFSNLYVHGIAPYGLAAVFAGVTTVIFALCGAEIVTIAAAESNESARSISRITIQVGVRILLFFVLSMIVIMAVVPWTEIRSGISPFATVLEHMGVPAGATIMKLIVLTAVLSCLNSGLYITSRVLFTLAAHGDAPQALVRLNGRRVPARAILFSTVVGYVAVAFSIVSPEVVFAFLVNASGAIMLMVYLLVVLAQIRLRRRFEREAPERLRIRVWLFPWLSWATAGGIVAVLAAMTLTESLAAQLYASIACLAVVLGIYGVARRPRLLRERRVPTGAASPIAPPGAVDSVRCAGGRAPPATLSAPGARRR